MWSKPEVPNSGNVVNERLVVKPTINSKKIEVNCREAVGVEIKVTIEIKEIDKRNFCSDRIGDKKFEITK